MNVVYGFYVHICGVVVLVLWMGLHVGASYWCVVGTGLEMDSDCSCGSEC